MKKLSISLLAIAAFVSISALHAQTVDEIINKEVEATGGKDKISQIKSLYMELSVQAMGNENPATITILNGKGYKYESEYNGQKIVQCYTDTGGWMINPMAGATTAQPLPEDQYKASKDQIYIGGGLLDYAAKGAKAELLGREKIGDTDTYKIKITNADSAVTTYYVDPSTYYVLKIVKTVNMMGQNMDISIILSNYQKTDYGYTVPYTSDINYGSQFSITSNVKKVEINKDVDPAIFDMPKQ